MWCYSVAVTLLTKIQRNGCSSQSTETSSCLLKLWLVEEYL